MPLTKAIFKELVKRGYSRRGSTRVWDLSDSKLWYLTPDLSEGFLKFAKYEPYRKTVVERELALLKKNASKICTFFGKKVFNLIDLGCGGGIKSTAFIRSLPRNVRLRYCPVDISSFFIDRSTSRVRALQSSKVQSIKSFVNNFDDFPDIVGILRSGTYHNNLVLLLGETISHYDIHDFLYHLSGNMLSGDTIVIGNGYRVGKRFVHIEKYKDSLFHQWFVHIMRALGFRDDEVSYDARFSNGRLELFYHVLVNKTMKYHGKTIKFRKGDEVVIGIQHKYYEKELISFCKMYFSEVVFLPDRVGQYCLLACKK